MAGSLIPFIPAPFPRAKTTPSLGRRWGCNDQSPGDCRWGAESLRLPGPWGPGAVAAGATLPVISPGAPRRMSSRFLFTQRRFPPRGTINQSHPEATAPSGGSARPKARGTVFPIVHPGDQPAPVAPGRLHANAKPAPLVRSRFERSTGTRDQWLSRGMPLVWAMRWYLTALRSTAPSPSWSTSPRWISCQGVWCLGNL